VVGFTIGSRGEVPGERKPVMTDDNNDNNGVLKINIAKRK